MGLFKRQKRTSAPKATEHQSAQPYAGDPVLPGLPGSAGYRGAARVTKNGMPHSRFNYVRPDGKPDR